LQKCVGFIQTITRLHDEFDNDKVDWDFVESLGEAKLTSKDGLAIFNEIAKRTRPVKLLALGNKQKGTKTSSTDAYSLSQFIGLQHPGPFGDIRFARAKEKGGTTAALNVVIKERKPDESGTQGGGKDSLGAYQGIPTPQNIESFFNMFLTGLDTQGNQMEAELYEKRIVAYYNQTGPEADKRLKAFEAGVIRAYDIVKRFKDRLDKIDEQQAKRNAA
jgi:hypothetical protein